MVSHEQPAARPGGIAASGAGLGAHGRTTTSSLAERHRARGVAELSVETGAAEGGDDGATARWDEETDEDGHRSPTFTSPPPLLIE